MKFNLAVLPGDGVGPEVTAEAVKVLQTVGKGDILLRTIAIIIEILILVAIAYVYLTGSDSPPSTWGLSPNIIRR
jgi:isocitrate/isopropylmalate dehydrogenase